MLYKLPYTKPPIRCYLHHAYPLGIIWDQQNSAFMQWFCANYNYIFSNNEDEPYYSNFFMDYSNVPFLYTQIILKDDLYYLLCNNSLENIIINFLKAQKYVLVIIDEYYLEGQWSYKKSHHMHEILITGVDEERKKFITWAYANKTYVEKEVDYSAIVLFPGDTFYENNSVIMKLYSKKQGDFVLTKETFINQIEDFLCGINPYYKFAGLGGYVPYKDKLFGYKIYERYLIELNKVSCEQHEINYICLRVMQEHFYGMYLKLLFIKESNIFTIPECDRLLDFYKEAMDKLKAIVFLGVKHNFVSDVTVKKEIIQQITNRLMHYTQLEKKYLNEIVI